MKNYTDIEIGDYVRDPLELPDTRLFMVVGMHKHYSGHVTLYLDNGCVMGADEVKEVFLPSEVE